MSRKFTVGLSGIAGLIGLQDFFGWWTLSGIIQYNCANQGAIVAGFDAGLIYNEFSMTGNPPIPPAKESPQPPIHSQ